MLGPMLGPRLGPRLGISSGLQRLLAFKDRTAFVLGC